MKWWSLLLWVTQFGFSVLFPLFASLFIGAWLQNAYSLSPWVCVVCAILGLIIAIRTAVACCRAMRKEADAVCKQEKKAPAHNEHD